MADDKKEPKKEPTFMKVERLPKGVKKAGTGNGVTVSSDETAPAATVEEQKDLIKGPVAGEDPLRPKQQPNVIPLSEAELKAERERGQRTLRGSNRSGPFRFNQPDLAPARGFSTVSTTDDENFDNLVRRLHRGLGLAGSEPGTAPDGISSRLDFATGLRKRDWQRAQEEGRKVHGIEPDSLEPTKESTVGTWHERLARVLTVFGHDEDTIRKHAAIHGSSFEDHVDGLHRVAQAHYDYLSAKQITHQVRDNDYWQHPETGERIKVSENHPDMPADFTRTKGKLASVYRDPQTMQLRAVAPKAIGWQVKSEADGSRTFYKVNPGIIDPQTKKERPTFSLYSHIRSEMSGVASGDLKPASRQKHADIANDLVQQMSGRFRGRTKDEGSLQEGTHVQGPNVNQESVEDTYNLQDVVGEEPRSGTYTGKGATRKRRNIARVPGKLTDDGKVAPRPPRARLTSGNRGAARQQYPTPFMSRQGTPTKPAETTEIQEAEEPKQLNLAPKPQPAVYSQQMIRFNTPSLSDIDAVRQKHVAHNATLAPEDKDKALPTDERTIRNIIRENTGVPNIQGVDERLDREADESRVNPRRNPSTPPMIYDAEGQSTGQRMPDISTSTNSGEWVASPAPKRRRKRVYAQGDLFTGTFPSKQELRKKAVLESLGGGTLVKPSAADVQESRKRI